MTAPHGTRTRYQRTRCRCTPCQDANNRFETLRAMRVPAGPAIHHLRRLLDAGSEPTELAEQLNVTVSYLGAIRRGDLHTLPDRLAHALLAIETPSPVPHPGFAWQEDAACRQAADPEAFFPGRGQHTDLARAWCSICPVVDACRQYADHYQVRDGIWAGVSYGPAGPGGHAT